MSDLQFLKAVERLLDRSEQFDKLSGSEQAGFRAQLTKLRKQVGQDEPEIKAVLDTLQDLYGSTEKPEAKKMTADDLVQEYTANYVGYSVKQRVAFKARVSRLLNEAKEKGDTATVDKLVDLQDRMVATAMKLSRNRIKAMAGKLTK